MNAEPGGRGGRAIGAAPPPPPLRRGDPPIAFLVDYDGTIALTDVSDTVMEAHVDDTWVALAGEYDAGFMGSRRLMEDQIGMLRADEAALLATAAEQPHDPGFVDLVSRAQAAGVPVEVVSDGFGFFIEAALEALGVTDVPVVTARTTFAGGRATIEFPNGHPTCFVCGTCKRTRVLEHQAAGRAVVFVGNGESDRYAAGYADVVFAKDALVHICLENGWPFERWTAFREIDRWLGGVLAAWQADPATANELGPRPRPLICGPELWGAGRRDPPAPAARPVDAAIDLDEGVAPG